MRIGYTGTSRSTSFRYDAFGRRTAVVENDGSTATETRYLWCGERLCQARDGADTVTRRYYAEGELAVATTGDVASFYAEDHLGSIRDLRLGDGQVLASYDYDPYGNPTRVSETGGVRADYRYAGLFHHAPSGLYLTHFRAYSPAFGRWISRDPIFEAGGINLYAYVDNEPINTIDPLGLVNTGPGDPFGPWGLEGARGGGGGVGPAARLVGGRYSTTTQGSIREITGRGRMTDMSGSARVTFDRFRGDTPANCSTTASGGAREVARLPNGTVVQLRDGRVDIFPPGGSPETIHFPGP